MSEYEFGGFQPLPCCGLAECLDAAGIDGRVPASHLAKGLPWMSSTPVAEARGETSNERPPVSLIHRLWKPAAPAMDDDAGPSMDARPETALDFRGLPAPEPMARALAAADALLPGGEVAVLTPLMPLPLLDLLAVRGLLTQSRALADGGVVTLIRRPHGPDAPDQPGPGEPVQTRQAPTRQASTRQASTRQKQDTDFGATRP